MNDIPYDNDPQQLSQIEKSEASYHYEDRDIAMTTEYTFRHSDEMPPPGIRFFRLAAIFVLLASISVFLFFYFRGMLMENNLKSR